MYLEVYFYITVFVANCQIFARKPPKSTSIIYNLSPPTTHFVGREDELTLLRLLQHQNNYVLVTGPPGVGKSEIVRVHARNYMSEYNGNVLWIDCHNTTSMVKAFRELAQMIKLYDLYSELTQITSIIYYVLRYFEKRNTLMVFDGVQVDNIVIPELRYFYINNIKVNVIATARDEKCCGPEYYTVEIKKFNPSESIIYLQNCLKLLKTYIDYNQYEELITTLRYIPRALNVTCEYFLNKNLRENFRIENFIQEVNTLQQLDIIEESMYNIAEEDLFKFTKLFEHSLVDCIFDKVIKPFDVNWVEVSKDYINLIKMVSENKNKLHIDVVDWEKK